MDKKTRAGRRRCGASLGLVPSTPSSGGRGGGGEVPVSKDPLVLAVNAGCALNEELEGGTLGDPVQRRCSPVPDGQGFFGDGRETRPSRQRSRKAVAHLSASRGPRTETATYTLPADPLLLVAAVISQSLPTLICKPTPTPARRAPLPVGRLGGRIHTAVRFPSINPGRTGLGYGTGAARRGGNPVHRGTPPRRGHLTRPPGPEAAD